MIQRICFSVTALVLAAAGQAGEVTPVVTRPPGAEAARIWPAYYASSGGNEIRNCRTWRRGWADFVEKRGLPMVRAHGALWIHNPGGVVTGKSMRFQQFRNCTEQAALSGDETLRLVADWRTFSEQMSRITAEGRLMIYVGSPSTLGVRDDETDDEWLARALDELAPVLAIDPKPAIGFDATYGHPAAYPPWDRLGGAEGLIARVLRHLTDEGYQVVVEPAILARAAWMNDISGLVATEFWWGRMLKDGQDIRIPHYKPEWGEHLSPTEVRGPQMRMYSMRFDSLAEQRETLAATLAAGYDAVIYAGELSRTK